MPDPSSTIDLGVSFFPREERAWSVVAAGSVPTEEGVDGPTAEDVETADRQVVRLRALCADLTAQIEDDRRAWAAERHELRERRAECQRLAYDLAIERGLRKEGERMAEHLKAEIRRHRGAQEPRHRRAAGRAPLGIAYDVLRGSTEDSLPALESGDAPLWASPGRAQGATCRPAGSRT